MELGKDGDSSETIKEKSPNHEKKELLNSGSGRKNKSSQNKKSAHRRSNSPVYWFPRKKTTDSYLKRKIKHLQEAGGMNLSLDETLGNANPHYTRIAREKIAAREAAKKAMEARKSAMVEASWCKILKAARIQSKEAEEELERAKKHAMEAFEAARAKGVMMYDKPDCNRHLEYKIETYSAAGGRPAHKITTAFETAFEVDREVAGAVKKAFVRLASSPSRSNREEFKVLIWKISQNPENNETGADLLSFESEIVDLMVERLKGLRESELDSLAGIVATCGLNAALLEVECARPSVDSSIGFKGEAHVPSLEKFLVKHVSRLEREVQEARKSNKNEWENQRRVSTTDIREEAEPDVGLGSILVRHVSRLEREVREAKKRNSEKENRYSNVERTCQRLLEKREKVDGFGEREDYSDLGAILVKHQSKIEKAKLSLAGSMEQQNGERVVQERRKARERELLESFGGLSLENSIRPRLSRIERDKIAWRRREEEQKRGAGA